MQDSAADNEPLAFDLIEDALLLLKRVGLAAYGVYGAGTLAFLWAFLSFFAHMSHNAQAKSHLAEYSFLLALAFAGMKITHALFFSLLMETLEGKIPGPVSWRKVIQAGLTQPLLQPLGLFLISVAALLILPFPWVVAFFQNAQWVTERDSSRNWISRSFRMARLWPKQNLVIHLFLFGAGLCIFLNIAAASFLVPYLLKSFFGINTVFTRSFHAYVNTSFFSAILALSWATLDPLVKAIYALRCFRGDSIRSGRDLRLALGRFKVGNPKIVSAIRADILVPILVVFFLLPFPLIAGTHEAKAAITYEANAVTVPLLAPSRLDSLMREEISKSSYGWKIPQRVAEQPGKENFLTRWVEKSIQYTESAIKYVVNMVRRFFRWLNAYFGKWDPQSNRENLPNAVSTLPTRILLVILLGVFMSGIAIFFLRRLSKKTPAPMPVASPGPALPDITREDIKADDLPEQEWLRLMDQLRAQGEHRLAIRALFLAMLSLLARKGCLTVARQKSNRDYQREVTLKSKRKPFVAESFQENSRRFDRIWYGSHPISEEDWEVSRSNYARVSDDDT